MHHGKMSGQFEPKFVGTDYFTFYHNDGGHAEITAILIDHEGRVIFNLRCRKCGFEDALKTKPNLWMRHEIPEPLERFHLSPRLKDRISKHRWDDL